MLSSSHPKDVRLNVEFSHELTLEPAPIFAFDWNQGLLYIAVSNKINVMDLKQAKPQPSLILTGSNIITGLLVRPELVKLMWTEYNKKHYTELFEASQVCSTH